ncbi:MAG: elongation factor G [Planctomycetes bacterium]|nr:elongation factor G [Planctomycetota bacterium]
MAHRSEEIRNLVLLGHGHSGKTAIIDALAYITKASPRHGNSLEGTSVSDTLAEEKERKHTLTSHLFSFTFDHMRMNVLDTPGHSDFVAAALSTLDVVEAAFLCVSATTGLTFHGRRLFQAAAEAGIGRAIVVTHPDGDSANFQDLVAELEDALGDTVVPVTYPDADGAAFTEIRDVMHGTGERAERYRALLAEHVAEADDEILERYLEREALSEAEFERYLPKAIAKEKVTPLFTVCAPRELGLKKLMSFVEHYFPSPEQFGGRPARKPGTETYDQIVQPSSDGPFVAKVFKTVVDPYVGRITYLRCFRGQLKAEQGFLNVRTGHHDNLTGVQSVEGIEAKPIDAVVAGDLFVVTKLDDLAYGDTVTVDTEPLEMKAVEFPDPTFALAVQPASRGDEQKIVQGLERLALEDPTFHVARDPNTGELIVAGTSPMHIDVQLRRLEQRFGVRTTTHAPSVAYRETVTAPAEGHHRHKKQTGGRGQFAEVYLRIRPLDRGEGFNFVDKVVGGAIPRQFIPEIEKGVQSFLRKGGLAGCRVVDVEVEVYDGKFHAVDSDQLSFQLAGERAFADAFTKARPILLEPLAEIEIMVPERFTGDVSSNLATLRGRMTGMEMIDGIQTIRAQAPLGELQDYVTKLRSMTAGEGTFRVTPADYEPVPPNVQVQIVAAHKAKLEAAKG